LFAGNKHKQKALKKGSLANVALKPAQISKTTGNSMTTTTTTATTTTTTGTSTVGSKGKDTTNCQCMPLHGVPLL
jgi:hypothetical protein